MNYREAALRAVVTLGAAALSFCAGGYVAAALYSRWFVPSLIERNPHDGQIGLALFGVMGAGALVGAAISLVAGGVWVMKALRSPKRPD